MLFVLAFDHRNSFLRSFWGIPGEPPPAQRATCREAKLVILVGRLHAVGAGLPAGRAGVLVDDEYGMAAAVRARQAGLAVAMPIEKSGQRELQFQHDPFFAGVASLSPDYVKVLVRYNVEADGPMNGRQLAKMASVQEWAAGNGVGFMLELLVPPEPDQAARADYDTVTRPRLVLRAVQELSSAGLRPDLWKLEGMPSRSDYEAIGQEVLRTRADSGCLVLGRGEDEAEVARWLRRAAGVPAFSGFAVGRTIWWSPLRALYDGTLSRNEAVEAIGVNYRRMVDVYLDAAGAVAT